MFFAVLLLAFNIWSVYNIPIAVVGVRQLLRSRREKCNRASVSAGRLPFVSVVVPMKNEEKVIGRLLLALTNVNYPVSRFEVVVVNDESTDKTGDICGDFARRFGHIKVFNRALSSTKAAALNFGVQHARGEIIATFDADSVPESDVVLKAVGYFDNRSVAAVQGRVCSINAGENMLTRFLSYESAVQYEAYIRGKDYLNLFVGLAGTCQFIRRSVLEEIGGWNEHNLSEDTELSLRLTEKDYTIKYASEVRTWEESPHSIGGLVRQRARWYRGNITVGFKSGCLMKKLSLRRFDAEMTLFGTYLIVLCLVSYFMAAWSISLPADSVLTMITRFTSFFTVLILASAGVALVCVTKPLRVSNLLWLPFIYAYWGFQSLIALYAIGQIVLRRPGSWSRTPRSGVVTAESTKEILTVR